MCGISAILGKNWTTEQLKRMVDIQHHRGPDDTGIFVSKDRQVGLGHNRLSIIDLSSAGHQPMSNYDESVWIVFNGEIYNYIELRSELSSYPYKSLTDTEVLLAAYERWGERCVEHFVGMFVFLIWDQRNEVLFSARDRFGIKPLYYHQDDDGTLFLGSEIKAIHAAGVASEPDVVAWSTYLTQGVHDHSDRTFWSGVRSLLPGHTLMWRAGRITIHRWYDLANAIQGRSEKPLENVQEEYIYLLRESVRFCFRSDVPVGINLSGGMDSSTLLGLVRQVQGFSDDVKAFTFTTGNPDYDELPWVNQMLAQTGHFSVVCQLTPEQVPDLALSVQEYQDEPFGGLPTLAYAQLFAKARQDGFVVLLDGQGMDEQWAGYDYYRRALEGTNAGIVQGTRNSPVKPECLLDEFHELATIPDFPKPFDDVLQNIQYRDAVYTKLTRALRFNDRISMRSSTELRVPFLDHRLFELAFRQPPHRKIAQGTQKWLLRKIAHELVPAGIVEAPKRPLQTPQREWLRGPLKNWAGDCIALALTTYGGSWFCTSAVSRTWDAYLQGDADNSFYIWQWISVGMMEMVSRV